MLVDSTLVPHRLAVYREAPLKQRDRILVDSRPLRVSPDQSVRGGTRGCEHFATTIASKATAVLWWARRGYGPEGILTSAYLFLSKWDLSLM